MTRSIPESNQTSPIVVLCIASVVSFLTPFMGSAVHIAAPAMAQMPGMTALLINWVSTAYLLAAAVCLVPAGRLADITGRVRIFTIGLIVFVAASSACAVAFSPATLIAARIGQGIGTAMIFGTSMAILVSIVAPEQRGRVLGINVASVYLGLSLGPVLGGLLTQAFGWRSIFIVMIPAGLSVLVLRFIFMRGEWADAAGEPFDWKGSILYGGALISIIYGFSLIPTRIGYLFGISGFAALGLFVFVSSRSRYPVMNTRLLLGNKVFALSNLAALIHYSATFGITFLLSLYLQYIKGLSARDAGLLLVIQPAVMTLLSPLAGRLSDRIAPWKLASSGMSVSALGLILLIALRADTSFGLIAGALVLIGIGFAFFSSPNTNAVMGAVDKRFLGVASGALGTMRLLGQMFSMGIIMILFSIYMGDVEIVPEMYPAFLKATTTAFIVFMISAIIGIFVSINRGGERNGSILKKQSGNTSAN